MSKDQAKRPQVTIYTDGACYNNRVGQGLGGAACILEFGPHRKAITRGWRNTTNNRMELWAMILGLEALKQPCDVLIVSDSLYGIAMSTNAYKHAAKNWLRKRKPIPNADLIKRIHGLSSAHAIRFQWVKGHAGHAENEECDRLAAKAAGTATEFDAPQSVHDDVLLA